MNLQESLSEFIAILAPLSLKYGSGDVEADLLICLFIAAAIVVLLSLRIFGRSAPIEGVRVPERDAGGDRVFICLQDVKNDLKKNADQWRGEAGYIRQELRELRRLLLSIEQRIGGNELELRQPLIDERVEDLGFPGPE